MRSDSGRTATERSALERYASARRLQLQRSGQTLTIWFSDAQRRFQVNLYGVFESARSLLLSAPVGPDTQLIAVMRDQPLNCRWTSPLAVYSFKGVVTELGFKPVPLLHVGQLHALQRHSQRRLPRAPLALPATISAGQTLPVLVTDLSTAGAQIALPVDTTLAVGQKIELALRLRLMDTERTVRLGCEVVSDRGPTDRDNPLIQLLGLSFMDPDETSALILHGYVQQLMLEHADRIGTMLDREATEAPLSDRNPGA